jgi:O-antigen ligase
MWLVYLLAGAVVPLLITPGLLFHYDTAPKIILMAVAAAWALVRFRSLRSEANALWSRREGRWFIALAAAQLTWFGIATATSTRPWLSLFGSGWRRFGFIEALSLMVIAITVAAALSARPAGVRPLLRMVVCAGLLGSFYGIFQYFGIDPFQPATMYLAHAGESTIVRPPGTLGHADYFGWWLAVEFFCAIALARIEPGLWKRLAAVTAVSVGIAVLLSGTRAALLAIAVGVIGMALESPSSVRIRRKHIAAATLAVVLLTAFLVSPAGTRLRARVVWAGDEPAGGARPLIWRDSLRMAAAKPVFGFGPETFLAAFAPYQSEELSRLFPDFHHESPHNLPLDALTSMGMPGLLLVAAWATMAGFAAVGARQAVSPSAVPLIAALVASAVAAMFNAASPGPLLLSLLVIAMLVASCSPGAPKVETQGSNTGVRWFLYSVSTCLALSLMAFGTVYALMEFRLERFKDNPGGTSYQSLLAVTLPGAAEDLYASRVLQLQCGKGVSFVAYITCKQQAMQAGARALKSADDIANAWYSLSMLSASQNDIFGTRRGIEAASQASPNWFKPHWALARLLSQTGEAKEAAAEATRAAFLDSNRDPEVVKTLLELTAERK